MTDLDALERRYQQLAKTDEYMGFGVDGLALIQRVRETESENAALREGRALIEEGLRGRWDGVYKMRTRIAQLEREQSRLQDAQDVACAIAMNFECEDAPQDCTTYRGGLCLNCLIRIALRDQTPPK